MSILPLKRLLERRDFLSSLLSPSSTNECNKMISGDRPFRDNQSLHQIMYGVNAANLPAHELTSLLAVLSDECPRSQDLFDTHSNIRKDEKICDLSLDDSEGNKHYDTTNGRKRRTNSLETSQQPSKKLKSGSSNNHHSILRFIERTLDQRFSGNPSSNQRDKFLDRELRSFFGTNDVVFRAEEKLISLVFQIAFDAIILQCVKSSISDERGNATTSAGVSSNTMKATLRYANNQLRPQSNLPRHESMNGSILLNRIIPTALRIIDLIVEVDISERSLRGQLHGNASTRQTLLTSVIERRRGKQNQSSQREANHHKKRTKPNNQNDPSMIPSIIMHRYPEEWLWLNDFRKFYSRLDNSCHQEMPPTQSDSASTKARHSCDNKIGESNNEKVENQKSIKDGETQESGFIIIRRKIESVEDLSFSSDDEDDNSNDSNKDDDTDNSTNDSIERAQSFNKDKNDSPKQNGSWHPSTPEQPIAESSPRDKLDHDANELRRTILEMPPTELSSAQVVTYATISIGNLLRQYGELDGTAGITRCGEVLVKGLQSFPINDENAAVPENTRFPLNDAIVSSLAKDFLTDATGALRAKEFLRSFVLPLVVEMNPSSNASSSGKHASRLLSSLVSALSRDRPIEFVESVLVPALTMENETIAPAEVSDEPSRFQCELITRVLRGKDSLSTAAISLLVDRLLPRDDRGASARGGMKWTETSMPLVTACLNRQPTLSDSTLTKLVDEISYYLSPKSSPVKSMEKSMKFSTLFHALVMKYGSQLMSLGKVETLKEAALRLKTFMSKSINAALKKLK